VKEPKTCPKARERSLDTAGRPLVQNRRKGPLGLHARARAMKDSKLLPKFSHHVLPGARGLFLGPLLKAIDPGHEPAGIHLSSCPPKGTDGG
jgi:hypothetical protein